MGVNLVIILILLINYINTITSLNQKCNFYVDITDGEKQGNIIIKNDISYTPDNYFYDGSQIKGCICNIKKCIRKCCLDGESIKPISDTLSCVMDNNNFSIDFVDFSIFHIIHGNTCQENEVKIMTSEDDHYDITYDKLNIDGKLYWSNTSYNYEQFCLDTFDGKKITVFCIPQGEEAILDLTLSLGMIISMPFLLATFIAYALLPDRNLHMKALMSYVINLLAGYLLLVIIQLTKAQISPPSCISLGYFCLFFFMVSFLWMNVICIDIYLAFSGLRGFSGSKNAERRRFILYCIYAWGVSILHIIVVAIIHSLSPERSWYDPGIGKGQCFLIQGYPELLYFYGPMGLLITINVVLFTITAFRIRSIKKDTAMLKKNDSKRHSYENDKQKFNLYLKLLFAMGVNWSLEIISWAVTWKLPNMPAAVWYLTDVCNAVYGVFIFFIFVFKRSIWKLLKKRYYSFIGKPYLAHSMTTNPTRATSYSTAHTSVTDSHHGGPITDNSELTTEN